MKYLPLILILLLFSCSLSESDSKIYGTWGYCTRDGKYNELKIDQSLSLLFTQGMHQDELAIYNTVYDNNKFSVKGINVDVMDGIDVYDIKFIDNDTIVMTNIYGSIHAVKISNMNNSKQWDENFSSLKSFRIRAGNWSCPDLRTENEKVVLEGNLQLAIDDSVAVDTTVLR